MTALYFTIEAPKKGKTTLRFHCDVLAREDADDDEIKIAKAIETALLGCIEAVAKEAKAKATTTRTDEGDGHDRIRQQSQTLASKATP